MNPFENAFGITHDDVSNVFLENGVEATDNQINQAFGVLKLDAVGSAALDGGDDIEQQTEAAYAEIRSQLIVAGMLPTAVVVYSERNGIFLGHALGLGFWSKLDSFGQPVAHAFESEQVASKFIKGSRSGGFPADLRFVRVVSTDKDHASMDACVKAGLPGWALSEDTPAPGISPA